MTRAWIAGLLAVAALALALRAPVAALPFERDEGEYAYLAWRWGEGEVPYRDAFDQKPPGVFALFALGLAFGETPAAVRWTAQALLLLALVGIAALGRRLVSPAAGLAAGALSALLTTHPGWLGNAVNAETAALPPLVGAALAARRARGAGAAAPALAGALATGALGAVALLCKPVVAPIVAYLAATAAWPRAGAAPWRTALARAGAAALGALAVLAPVGAYFAAAGAWAPLLDATLWNNLAYAGGLPLADYPRYFEAQIARGLPAFAPILAAAALGALAAVAPARWVAHVSARRAGVAWLLGWLLATVPAVAAGGYFRAHYFQLAIPPLALLAAAGLDAAARALAAAARPARAGLAPAAVGLAATALVGHALARDAWYWAPGGAAAKMHRLYGSNPFPEAPVLGRWLAARAAPGDRAFVYGSEPQLLFHARVPSASRYIFVYPLTMPMGRAAERQREVLAELAAAPPRWIVGVFVRTSLLEQPGTPPQLREGVRALVERDYEVAAVVPFDRARSGRVVEGRAARSMWRARPLWDGAVPWAAFVVWERTGPGEPPS